MLRKVFLRGISHLSSCKYTERRVQKQAKAHFFACFRPHFHCCAPVRFAFRAVGKCHPAQDFLWLKALFVQLRALFLQLRALVVRLKPLAEDFPATNPLLHGLAEDYASGDFYKDTLKKHCALAQCFQLFCWATRIRTRKGRTRICSVTITP